jgi:hypothetical protein
MWESRVLCGISKRGGNGGKVGVGLFHGFHGAPFPQLGSGFWAFSLERRLGTTEGLIGHFSKAASNAHFSRLRRAERSSTAITLLG